MPYIWYPIHPLFHPPNSQSLLSSGKFSHCQKDVAISCEFIIIHKKRLFYTATNLLFEGRSAWIVGANSFFILDNGQKKSDMWPEILGLTAFDEFITCRLELRAHVLRWQIVELNWKGSFLKRIICQKREILALRLRRLHCSTLITYCISDCIIRWSTLLHYSTWKSWGLGLRSNRWR